MSLRRNEKKKTREKTELDSKKISSDCFLVRDVQNQMRKIQNEQGLSRAKFIRLSENGG